jgi:hypothetical protein
MKPIIKLAVFFGFWLIPRPSIAQFETLKDSLVQLYGIVMTADSLKALPGTTVAIKGSSKATMTDDKGMFYLLAKKGDIIQFSFVGYKPEEARVPHDIDGNQYSVIKTMSTDTQYLPVTIIRPWPTKAQFARDFVNQAVSDPEGEIAKKNNSPAAIKELGKSLSQDAGEASAYHLNKDVQAFYYSGQAPSMNIFDIPSWKKFIQAWKRGDFKKQTYSGQ